jgi:AraC family transcriptional regulator
MTPRIEISEEKKLIGMRLTMSFSDYKIGKLWGAFMPRRKEIIDSLNEDLHSIAIYPQTHFADFKPTNVFERWSAVEVSQFDNVPSGMETIVLPAGLYAVFEYKGLSTDTSAGIIETALYAR